MIYCWPSAGCSFFGFFTTSQYLLLTESPLILHPNYISSPHRNPTLIWSTTLRRTGTISVHDPTHFPGAHRIFIYSPHLHIFPFLRYSRSETYFNPYGIYPNTCNDVIAHNPGLAFLHPGKERKNQSNSILILFIFLFFSLLSNFYPLAFKRPICAFTVIQFHHLFSFLLFTHSNLSVLLVSSSHFYVTLVVLLTYPSYLMFTHLHKKARNGLLSINIIQSLSLTLSTGNMYISAHTSIVIPYCSHHLLHLSSRFPLIDQIIHRKQTNRARTKQFNASHRERSTKIPEIFRSLIWAYEHIMRGVFSSSTSL